jgi:Uma2 family endonuclease
VYPPRSARTASALVALERTAARARTRTSDLRIRVYPDVSAVCAPRELDPDARNTVLNPKAMIQVTSPSSEEYDLGKKRENYLRIAAQAS